MEEKGGTNNSGVTVKGDEAPDSYRVVARENNEFGGSTVAPPVSEAVVTLEAAAATTQVSAALAAPGATAPAAAATPTPVSAPVAAATPTPVSAPVAAAVTTPATVSVSSPAAGAATTPATVAVTMPVAAGVTGTEAKKKRGRPRKYGPDGKVMALSPMPISALIPLTGDFSAWKHGRGRSIDSFKKKHKLEFESPGSRVSYSVGANFTPHVITVNAGEI